MMCVLFVLAALALDPPFCDHAVLQRDKPVVVRGSADAGAAVSVSFAGNTAKGVADAAGRWSVKLPAMPASKEPRNLEVTAISPGNQTIEQSNNRTILHDILVGEVWLASGQSNMEMPLWHPTRKRFRDKMGGLMRQFPPPANLRVMMTWPERGVSATPRRDYPVAWTVPDEAWLSTNKFSACAYYFGRELLTTLDVPVGVIAAFWGGTEIGYWVPDSGWESVKGEPYVATNILERVAKRVALERENKRRGWPGYPGDLWNEQVAVFAPYTVRGMIWYQGESNIDENFSGRLAYSKNLRALFDGWRREFDNADMKFLFVELAPFSYPWLKLAENDERLARLCDEQQRFEGEEPDAHLACISDVGDPNDIHPCRKWEVGVRLAAFAFQHVYGLPVRADPPRAVAAKLIAPGVVEIELRNAQGLYRWMPEVSLWTDRQKESSPVRFVAASGEIVDCETEIVGGRIIAMSDRIVNPVAVTYLRRRTDEGNIYNDSALPLGTFSLKVEAGESSLKSLKPAVLGYGWAKKWWMPRHEEKIAARNASYDVVMIGDSITHFFESKSGSNVWKRCFADAGIKALNLGFGGDATENVLWRIDHGELDGLDPKVVVIEIGVNNRGNHGTDETVDETYVGIRSVLAAVRRKLPKAKVILQAMMPFEKDPKSAARRHAFAVNERTKALADGKDVLWLDIRGKIMNKDGTISTDVLYDYVHPTEKGYELWAEDLMPLIRKMLNANVNAENRTFGDGEKVCFFGDSITHEGFYHKFVTDYYLTRFPDRNIRFRNVGVSGDTAGGARTRYEANIRANNPTTVSFFFGMNDKGSGIYTAPLTDQKIMEQESRRTAYTTNMLDLVARVKRDFPKASLYFCTPTPFDDTVVFPGQEGPCARLGEKAALKGYAELVRSWCAKEGGTLVDLSATLNAFNDRKQRNDPSYTIIGKDRVHPGKPGHFLILQEFLRAQGAPGLVSSVDVDARTGKARAENAAVTDFAAADGSCSFTVTEGALPYPVDAVCGEIAAETDFDGCFNREFLCVTGLVEEARYALKIDGGEICRRTGREFASGLNLATFRTTPMYRQALAVAEVTERKRVTEQRLVCDLYFVRLWCQWMKFDPEDFDFLAKWYDDCKTKTNYCESKVPTYLKGWKDRDKSAAALERLDEEMWSARRISPHRFEIVPVVGNVIRFEDGEGVFAEMEASDASAVDLKVHRQGAFTVLTVAPAKGAAREIRELALPEVRLVRDISDARTLGSGGLKPLGEDVGSYTFLAVAEPRTRKGVVAAFATSETGSGVIFSENRGGQAVLKPVLHYGRLRLGAGETVKGETFVIGAFDDCREGLERYGDFVATQYGVKLKRQPSGYCTYYSDKFDHSGTEESTKVFMGQVDKLVPWGFDFYQIDGSWQNGEKKLQPGQPEDTGPINRRFTDHDPKGTYPHGMKGAAETVAAKGVTPGLWFMPFSANTGDSWFDDKRDLFVRSDVARTRPADAAPDNYRMNQTPGASYETFWGGTAFDMTNPKTRKYVGDEIRNMTRNWGYRYLKYDGIWVAMACEHIYISDGYKADDIGYQTFFDPKATNISAFRRGAELVREAAGPDTFLLGCNCAQNMRIMAGAYGLVDAMRIGPDNNASWSGVCRGPIRGTPRYFLNGRVWYNDPDPVYVRNKIPVSRARNSATWVSLTGALYAFSDWLPDLSDERLDILRRTLAPHRRPTKVRPVDLFESDLANTWLLADGDVRIFGFFNWDEKSPLAVNYDAAYAGLDPEKTYVGFDFWANRFVAPFKGMVRAEVGAGDAKVWQLREFDGTRPVLVSTSRHIASPLFEVTDEKWDASARTLSGSSQVVANDPYELRLVLPGGMSVASAEIGGAKAEVKAEGRTARIRANPIASGTVNWKIKTEITGGKENE